LACFAKRLTPMLNAEPWTSPKINFGSSTATLFYKSLILAAAFHIDP
jgi:hypothetical protein